MAALHQPLVPAAALLLTFHLLLLLVLPMTTAETASLSNGGHGLQLGFYSRSCPSAVSTVRATVKEAVEADKSDAARLLRLSFHDCFVQGCDGSILLDTGAGGGERLAIGNAGVLGFEIIEAAKKRLEKSCPGVVSCADIVALAARDAVALSHGPDYDVPTGRRDGRISSLSLANDLPDVNDPIDVLEAKFHAKGMSVKDLLLLTAGAHTIGTAACFFMDQRLYNFTGRNASDPTINPKFLPRLESMCPLNTPKIKRLPLDWPSPSEFKFDDHILHNIVNGFAVLASDAQLVVDGKTRGVLESYVVGHANTSSFGKDFAQAMIRMGSIQVKTGSDGEIRKVCNKIN